MKNIITTLVVLLPFVFSSTVYGAGFALYEYSAKGTAMGGATVANGAEAASLGNNPALITELEGTQVQVGVTAVMADATTTAAGQSRSLKDKTFFLPNFFITHKWSDDITLGLGGFSRYGLGGEYQDPYQTWAGSNLAYKVNLETFSFTPTIAIKANDELSFAMGLEAQIISFTQNSYVNALPSPAPKGGYEVSGSGVNWGGNFSLLYKPQWAEKWSLGAMYRSKIKATLNGRVKSDLPFSTITSGKLNIRDGNAEGSITLPDSITAGIAFHPTEKWTMEAGIVGTFWSSYDQILIQYTDTLANAFINPQKKYKDTYRLNFGTEYKIDENWAVRAGYVFDKSPINKNEMDTLVPVDDRHIGSIGAGYAKDNWSIDVYYAHIFGKDLSGKSSQLGSILNPTSPDPAPMKYTDGKSDMYGITFGYKF